MTRFSKLLVGAIALICLTQVSSAALIQIQLGGVDLTYNGTEIIDGGASDPDQLTNATFMIDGVQVGDPDTTDVTLDLRIPGVAGIPDTGGKVTSAAGGTLDLQLGDGQYLSLELDAATVLYQQETSTIGFAFACSAATNAGLNLPHEISIDNPIGISFSTRITEPVSQSNGSIDFFQSAGTGEIQGFGVGVPEPATMGLLAFGGLALLRRRRNQS